MNPQSMEIVNEQAGILFRDGKINTVVAVLFIIFAGICIFLFLMEKKVSRLEKKVDSLSKSDLQNQNSKS